MRKTSLLVVTLAFGGLLASCSGDNTAEIAKMKVKGGAYEKGLHKGYLTLAKSEHGEYDQRQKQLTFILGPGRT